jgi:site-specific recombinase
MIAGPDQHAPQRSDHHPAFELRTFVTSFAHQTRGLRTVAKIHKLLVSMDAATTLEERLDWMERLATWIHRAGAFELESAPGDEPRTARFRFFMCILSDVEPWRESFARLFSGVIGELRGTRLFTGVGIPVEPGFWREAWDRIATRLLPVHVDPHSFGDLLGRLFPTKEDAAWLGRVPAELWEEFLLVLERTSSPPSRAWYGLRQSMADAVHILAARTCSLGLAPDIQDRLPEYAVRDLPFLKLVRVCDGLALTGPPEGKPATVEQALVEIDACRDAVQKVHEHVEEYGVSVDLVYRLDLICAKLARLEEILAHLTVQRTSRVAPHVGRFLFRLFETQSRRRSLRALFRTSLQTLARKVVERTGKTGEHYITQTRAEWRKMLLSAAGGGFLTAFTAAFKFLLGLLKLPAFFAGLAASINYAGSFLLMTALGFTLATKQPSMTASALAASLEEQGDGAPNVDRLVTLIAQIARSQLAAAVGNIGMVIPTALGFDYAWRAATGRHFLDEHEAEHVVSSMHPLTSGTIYFAALTGVLLWCSSLAAGWVENWVAYRRIPEALEHNRRLRAALGVARTKRLCVAIDHGVSSFGGNVALGFLLGMVPIIGAFFGLPAEVRHVTLSTGSLTLAAAVGQVEQLGRAPFIAAMIGVAIIGLLNFGVSFALALGVALRARGAFNTDTTRLVQGLVRRMLRSPFEFVFPPKGAVAIPPPPPSRRVPR